MAIRVELRRHIQHMHMYAFGAAQLAGCQEARISHLQDIIGQDQVPCCPPNVFRARCSLCAVVQAGMRIHTAGHVRILIYFY